MQHSVACISTCEGGIPDIIEEGKTGFVVDKRNSEQLAYKIEQLINNPLLIAQVGVSARKRFEERFTLEILQNGDYLIPDGASIVKACRWLKAKSRPTERVAGWDLFEYEMRAPSGSPKGEGTVCEPRGTTCESGIESGGLKNGRR